MEDKILNEYKDYNKVALRILARWIAEDLINKQAEKEGLLKQKVADVNDIAFNTDFEQSIEDF